MELLTQHLGNGLMLALMLSLPAVLTAASIGLVVGILQAVTQVQEQTIAAAPKILGVFAILLLGGGLMMTMMENYLRESFQIAFNEIPQDGKFLLPPKTAQTSGHARARAFFQMQAEHGPKSDKLQDFSAQWQVPGVDAKSDGTATLTVKQNKSKDGALGVAEKMSLTKNP